MKQPTLQNFSKSLFAALLLLTGLFGANRATAQIWEFSFGGQSEDYGEALVQTKDQGFLLVGYGQDAFIGDGDQDVLVVRTDIDGDEVWTKYLDEGFVEEGFDVVATGDGSFTIAGNIQATQVSSIDAYLLRIDGNGNILWSNSFGGSQKDQAFGLTLTSDGGYLLVGRSNSFNDGTHDDIYLVKTDADGNFVWEKTFGGEGDDDGRAVVEVADGYVLVGTTIEPSTNKADIILLKTDLDGNELWSEQFGTPNPDTYEEGQDLIATNDGNFLMTGHSDFKSVLVIKADSDGMEIWRNSLADTLVGAIGQGLTESNDAYAVTGIVELTPSNADIYIGVLDKSTGFELWSATYGKVDYIDWGRSIIPRVNGGYAITGYNAEAIIIGGNDMTLVKTDIVGHTYTNYLQGKVYQDELLDCDLQPFEDGLKDWLVIAEGPERTFYGTTDENGFYNLIVDTGQYVLKVIPENGYWSNCGATEISIYPSSEYNIIEHDFGFIKPIQCPWLSVDASTGLVIPGEESVYSVTYFNSGTTDAADAQVRVVLDEDLSYVGSSIPFSQQIDDSIYLFDIGDIPQNNGGNFTLTLAVDGGAIDEQAVGLEVSITPDEYCFPPDPGWNGASLEVTGKCNGDQVEFTLKNVGVGAINAVDQLDYIVIEDQIIGHSENIGTLLPDGTMTVLRPADGTTYRVVATQAPGHPGFSFPTAFVEGCVDGGGSFSTGNALMFHDDDKDPFRSIDVQEAADTGLAADMRAYPKGYRGDTIAANTDIEYLISFRNESDDTVRRVVIRDTLSANLDISGVRAGTGSHPYDFRVYENGIVKFLMEDIELLPGQMGFVKFRVPQLPDLPACTEIVNQAHLTVGYEAPYLSVLKTLIACGDYTDFVEIVVSVIEPGIPGVSVDIFPNPLAGSATIQLHGQAFDLVRLSIFDPNGRLLRQESFRGNEYQLQRQNLASGTYFYRLETAGQLIQSGKMIVH